MFLSRNPHTWRNGRRRIAPDAVERGAFLPAQPFGPPPLHSTGGLQRGLQSVSPDGRCGRDKRDRAWFADLPKFPAK
jgi:hypothetical protein